MLELLFVSLLAAAAPTGESGASVAATDWPRWRGPLDTGYAPEADPPVEWSETENVRYKVAIPGKGHSTPIVYGDRIFLTTAIPAGDPIEPRYSGRPGAHDNLPVTHRQSFVVLALDRRNGKFLWQTPVHEETPVEGGHETGSFASASPVTDGEHLIVSFGSFGLFGLDLEGVLHWSVDLGQMHTKHGHGEGSSPALHGDSVVVNWDHEGQSFVAAFDKRTGEERWRVPRDEVSSWATPIVVVHRGKPQAIVPGTSRMRGYDLATGRVLWECGGLAANICASPVHHDGIVIAGSSYTTRGMIAVDLDGARGDVTGTPNRLWKRERGTPYVPSPLLYGDVVYFLAHYQNVLSCASVRTGENDGGPLRLKRLGNIYASPVGAAGRIYVTDLEGSTLVLTHAREPETLALNRLEDRFSASAALAGRELFLRGERALYCLADEDPKEDAGEGSE